jgi:phosphoglucosamine mutase
MAQSVFGTDGVRGRANAWPVTPDMALRLGQAAGARFRSGGDHARVVIGKDTRLSGYMLESALQAGFTSAGMDVMLLGPVPTPAVGMLTRSLRADVGVMISASHNPYQDNGVKLFGPDGYKISDEDEAALTAMLDAEPSLAPADRIGRARRIDGGQERYVEFAKATFPRALRLDGLRIALDCANGAAYRTAPTALWELGAEVVPLGVEPNGRNINDRCGSTHPEACRQAVLDRRADIGIALDGDADRVHLIDEKGRLVDGDQLMALIAGRWADEGRLTGGALVATVMSNLGLERWLGGRGLRLERTKVGDRHVIERMRTGGFNVGGEQSGHIVLSDLTTTGDGLIAALQALAAMVETGRRASEVLHLFDPAPQILRSVRNPLGAAALQAAAVREAIAAAEAALGASGRLLVRPSGTEPVIRVMAEGEDAAQVEQAVAGVAEALARG